ncbi:large tegument protein [Proboscivirus elephantidbeta4]|uniref:Large tegument protein n=1 Tax=Elephant endotheliotropic herpesvirus 4 TaxID=548914 RepID=A0A0S1TQM3_9BETA|nr:large tegument protein [Elephant endotheliotropic herpesvirus 4]ALM25989.1 large tegument protein [Elephant endotheliotropic herpesvirus 4]
MMLAGSRNQNHNDFGQRRGSQCMCNCFVFLHACYLKQPENLTAANVDEILVWGTLLDAHTPLRDPRYSFRFPAEVPTHIITPFGETMHALGPVYGGLVQSVQLDGQCYLGLFDFLWYLRQRRERKQRQHMTTVIVTINSFTCGLCIKGDNIYLFDPHATFYSANASVVATNEMNLVFQLMYRENLYFNAVEVHFIGNVQNVSDVEVSRILSHLPERTIHTRKPAIIRPVPVVPAGNAADHLQRVRSLHPHGQPRETPLVAIDGDGNAPPVADTPTGSYSRPLVLTGHRHVFRSGTTGGAFCPVDPRTSQVERARHNRSVSSSSLTPITQQQPHGVSVEEEPRERCFRAIVEQNEDDVDDDRADQQQQQHVLVIPQAWGERQRQNGGGDNNDNIATADDPSSFSFPSVVPYQYSVPEPLVDVSVPGEVPRLPGAAAALPTGQAFLDECVRGGGQPSTATVCHLLPSVAVLEQLLANLLKYDPPPESTMVIASDHVQCEMSLLSVRIHHLFCQLIDVGVNNGTGLHEDVELGLRHLADVFRDFDMHSAARLMDACVETKLDVRRLYYAVAEYPADEVTRPYLQIIMTKLQALLRTYRSDTVKAVDWIEKYYMHLLNDANPTPAPPSDRNLVAFAHQDFRSLAATCRDLFERQILHDDQSELLYHSLKKRVIDYNDVPAAKRASEELSRLEHGLQQHVADFVHNFYDEAVASTVEEFADIVTTGRNNIIAGNMPVRGLERVWEKGNKMIELLHNIRQVNEEKRKEYVDKLVEVEVLVSYLLDKERHDPAATVIPEHIKSMKEAYNNRQTAVALRDKRTDICALYKPDMTIARIDDDPAAKKVHMELMERHRQDLANLAAGAAGDLVPLVQESSDYYVDIFEVEDMDGEDMDVMFCDNQRDLLRAQLAALTLDNLAGAAQFMKEPEFQEMLRTADFAHMFELKIVSLCDAVLNRMTTAPPVKQTVFFHLRGVIANVYNVATREKLQAVALLLESLNMHVPIKRVTDAKKIAWKIKRHQAVWDLVRNRRAAVEFAHLLGDLMNEFKKQSEEDAWVRRAKNYTITSHADTMRFLFNAPSYELRQEYEPRILRKLKEFEDGRAKTLEQQDQRDRKRIAEHRAALEHAVLAALESETYGGLTAQSLTELRSIYVHETEQVRLYTDFNQKLGAVMAKKQQALRAALEQAVLDNLRKSFNAPKNAGAFRDMVNALDEIRVHGLMTAGNLRLFDEIYNDATFLDDLVKDWVMSEQVFRRSHYRRDYEESRRLHDLATNLTNPKAVMDATEARLRDALGRDAPVAHKDFMLHAKELAILSAEDQHLLGTLSGPFKRYVDEELLKKTAELNDLLTRNHIATKYRIDAHNELITETKGNLSYVIKKHYIKITNIARFDVDRLCRDPIRYVQEVVLPGLQLTPYIESGMILQWLLELRPLIAGYLDRRNDDLLDALESQIRAEMDLADELSDLEASLSVTFDPSLYESILYRLDRKRVKGGEKAYKKYEETLAELQHSKEVFEKALNYEMKYDRLLDEIRTYKYGLDCAVMLDEIDKVEREAGDSAKGDPARDPSRLRAHVKNMLHFQKDIVTKQPSVMDMKDFLTPILYADDLEFDDSSSRVFHRAAFRPRAEDWYAVDNVFGERNFVNRDGCPSALKICYHNCVLKYYDFHQDEIDRPVRRAFVSRNYYAHEVACELGATVYAYWDNIVKFPLSKYIQSPAIRRNPHLAPIYSMKLCVYAIDFYYSHILYSNPSDYHRYSDAAGAAAAAWSGREGGGVGRGGGGGVAGGRHVKIPERNFMALIMAFYPNIVMGLVTIPIEVGLNSLLSKFSQENFYKRCNVNQVPAPADLFANNNIEAYCIHERQWDTVSPAELFWNYSLMKEVGGAVSKLTVYILAVLTLPTEYLHHLWAQYKPTDIPDVSIYAYVNIVFRGLFNNNAETRTSAPRDSASRARIAGGGDVFDAIRVRKSEDVDELMRNFQEKCDLLDCILGALMFNVEIVVARRICKIHEDTCLVVNMGNFTSADPDYSAVMNNKNLDLSEFTSATWSNNMIEQSWFEVQCERLRSLMSKSARNPGPILVLVDETRTVFDGYIPRSDRTVQPKLFTSDHIYTEQIHTGYDSSAKPVEFAFCPTDMTFISNPYDISRDASREGRGGGADILNIPDSVYESEIRDDSAGAYDLYAEEGVTSSAADAATKRLDAKKRAAEYVARYLRAEYSSSSMARQRRTATDDGADDDDLDGYDSAEGDDGGGGKGGAMKISKMRLPLTVVDGSSTAPTSMADVMSISGRATTHPRESSGEMIRRQFGRAIDALLKLQDNILCFKDKMLDMLHKLKTIYL